MQVLLALALVLGAQVSDVPQARDPWVVIQDPGCDNENRAQHRYRLAAALLPHVDDPRYFNEVWEHAFMAVVPRKEMATWAANIGMDKDAYEAMALEALSLIIRDPRAQELRERAMQAENPRATAIAVQAMCEELGQ